MVFWCRSVWLKIIGGIFCLFVANGHAANTTLPDHSTWSPNGVVNAQATFVRTLYIGGDFSYVGPTTGGVAKVDMDTTVTDEGFPEINGQIYSVIKDEGTCDCWYVGGVFSYVGSAPRSNLVRVLADNTVDPDWNPNITGGAINDIAVTTDGSTVYIGGSFTSVGGVARNNLAAVDAATGLATSWDPSPDNVVNSLRLSLSSNKLFVGGVFTNIGGLARNNIAKVDLLTGSAEPLWDPNLNGEVKSIIFSGDLSSIYVGGAFTTVGAAPATTRNKFVEIGELDGAVLALNPNVTGVSVNALELAGSRLFIGGNFTHVGVAASIVARNHAAAVDVSTGEILPWDPSPNAPIQVLAVSKNQTELFVGGDFNTIVTKAASSIDGKANEYFAVFSVGGLYLPRWTTTANNSVYAVGVGDGTIVAGGVFTSLGGQRRENLAALNVVDGKLLGWNPKVDAPVHEILVTPDGLTLFAAGQFLNVNQVSQPYVTSLNTFDGATNVWDPGVTGTVRALALSADGAVLYMGGDFSGLVGGEPRNYLAAVGASDALIMPWIPSIVGSSVRDILLNSAGDKVYIGGTFSEAGGELRSNLAIISATGAKAENWIANVEGITPRVNTLALSSDESKLYVGGNFSSVNGVARSSLAEIDLTAQVATLTTWGPNTGGASEINALAVNDGTIFVGGDFTAIDLTARTSLASMYLGGVSPWVSSWNPVLATAPVVKTLQLDEQGGLLVGGKFEVITGDIGNELHSGVVSYPFKRPVITANPPAGKYKQPVNVSLSCVDNFAQLCADIYYSDDGQSFNNYSPGPIAIGASKTIKYFAVDNEGVSSGQSSAKYIIDTKLPKVTASLAANQYIGTNLAPIVLNCSDGQDGSGCAKVYFTMDGSVPTTASSVYTDYSTLVSDPPLLELREGYSDLAFGGGVYVAVGDSGRIASSADKVTWVDENSGTDGNLHSVIWIPAGGMLGGTFVAVGDAGLVLHSSDGKVWTKSITGTKKNFFDLAWDGEALVVVGEASTMIFSTNLVSWSNRGFVLNVDIDLTSISVRVNGSDLRYVVSGKDIVLLSDDGYVWTSLDVLSVASSGREVVAVTAGGVILYSRGDNQWEVMEGNLGPDLNDVVWNGRMFVSVGDSGLIKTSSDGRLWVTQSSPTANNLNSVAWLGGRFIAVGENTTIITSNKGEVWSSTGLLGVDANALPVSTDFYDIAWSGSLYVVVGDQGTIVSSADFSAWKKEVSPLGDNLKAILWNDGHFMIVGENTAILQSPDGAVWEKKILLNLIASFKSITAIDSSFLISGDDGIILRTFDAGDNWNSTTVAGVRNINSITWDGNKLLVAGDNRTIAQSGDLLAWSVYRFTDGDEVFSANAITNDGLPSGDPSAVGFVAVGDKSIIHRSRDGILWSSTASLSPRSFNDVSYASGSWVIVGDAGIILVGHDGVVWTKENSGSIENLNGVSWSGSEFLVGGKLSTIITSNDAVLWQVRSDSVINLKFFAVDEAGNVGDVKSSIYDIDPTPPIVSVSPAGGVHTTFPLEVTMQCDDGSGSGCKHILYTLDQSTPSLIKNKENTFTYSGPITLDNATVLLALAEDNYGNEADVKTDIYLFDAVDLGRKSGVGSIGIIFFIMVLLALCSRQVRVRYSSHEVVLTRDG